MKPAKESTAVKVRMANASDAEQLVSLCEQLGYPSSLAEIKARLASIDASVENVLFVAQDDYGDLTGFVGLCARPLIVSDLTAEITGIVVDRKARGNGVGKRLLEEAEKWGRDRGAVMISLRSNVIREEAHKFYLHLGFEISKTSLTFRKKL